MDALLEPVTAIETDAADLYQFLQSWDEKYRDSVKNIPLFNPALTKNWSDEQKIHFAKIFYHARGHFHDFLWYMGNYAPNSKAKAMVLQNIAEEFGGSGRSHEQLYFDFAASVGADLDSEIRTEQNYLPCIRQFNKGHLEWLRNHDWQTNLAAFSAYEKLDNVDYVNLYALAESFGLTKRELGFFSVHIYVKHFDATLDHLCDIWRADQQKIKEAFDFVAHYQFDMWKSLSEAVFNYA